METRIVNLTPEESFGKVGYNHANTPAPERPKGMSKTGIVLIAVLITGVLVYKYKYEIGQFFSWLVHGPANSESDKTKTS